MNIDAIRNRERNNQPPITQAERDRRDLLAEVDRLTDTLALVDDDRMFRAEQLQRALPVIKAARAVNAGSNEWSALRDALAEYDR